MEIVQIVLIAIIATILFILLKDLYPTFAFFILIITSLFILQVVIKQIAVVFVLLHSLSERAKIDSFHLNVILKIIGIAYLTEFGASITKDAGLTSVAANVELAGKVFIIILAVPILLAVVEMLLKIIPMSSL